MLLSFIILYMFCLEMYQHLCWINNLSAEHNLRLDTSITATQEDYI